MFLICAISSQAKCWEICAVVLLEWILQLLDLSDYFIQIIACSVLKNNILNVVSYND